MIYYEIKIEASLMYLDQISALAMDCGASGTQIISPTDRSLLRSWEMCDDDVLNESLSAVVVYAEDREYEKRLLKRLGRIPYIYTCTEVRSADWENEWKKNFKPIRVGECFLVIPSWEQVIVPDELIPLHMDPGNAFGTGSHETTSLCVSLLEKYVSNDAAILDVGTGSGILAMVAAKLGASTVDAVDIDADAVQTAQRNMDKNEVSDIVSVQEGNLGEMVKGPYDLVVANLLAEIIIDFLPQAATLGKCFIFSGIIDQAYPKVVAALRKYGYLVVEKITKGEWVAVVARREDASFSIGSF